VPRRKAQPRDVRRNRQAPSPPRRREDHRPVVGACGLRGQLLEDARQTVFELALRAKDRPDTLDGWKTYVDPTHVAHHGNETAIPDAGLPGPGGLREPLPPEVMVETNKAEVALLRAKIADAVKAKDWEDCMRLNVKLDGIEPSTPGDPVKLQCENGLGSELMSKGRPHVDGGKPRPKP